jgi:hypothetical protein
LSLQHTHNNSLLHLSIQKDFTEIIPDLIKAGANINAQNIQQHTPLDKALMNGYIEVANLLIRFGANVSNTNQSVADEILYSYIHCIMDNGNENYIEAFKIYISCGGFIGDLKKYMNNKTSEAKLSKLPEVVELIEQAANLIPFGQKLEIPNEFEDCILKRFERKVKAKVSESKEQVKFNEIFFYLKAELDKDESKGEIKYIPDSFNNKLIKIIDEIRDEFDNIIEDLSFEEAALMAELEDTLDEPLSNAPLSVLLKNIDEFNDRAKVTSPATKPDHIYNDDFKMAMFFTDISSISISSSSNRVSNENVKNKLNVAGSAERTKAYYCRGEYFENTEPGHYLLEQLKDQELFAAKLVSNYNAAQIFLKIAAMKNLPKIYLGAIKEFQDTYTIEVEPEAKKAENTEAKQTDSQDQHNTTVNDNDLETLKTSETTLNHNIKLVSNHQSEFSVSTPDSSEGSVFMLGEN